MTADPSILVFLAIICGALGLSIGYRLGLADAESHRHYLEGRLARALAERDRLRTEHAERVRWGEEW